MRLDLFGNFQVQKPVLLELNRAPIPEPIPPKKDSDKSNGSCYHPNDAEVVLSRLQFLPVDFEILFGLLVDRLHPLGFILHFLPRSCRLRRVTLIWYPPRLREILAHSYEQLLRPLLTCPALYRPLLCENISPRLERGKSGDDQGEATRDRAKLVEVIRGKRRDWIHASSYQVGC